MSKGFLYDEGDELITRKEDVGGLPDTSEASAGDVLSLDEDKEPVWSAPSGGGGLPIITDYFIGGTPTKISFLDTIDREPLTFEQLLAKAVPSSPGGTYFLLAAAPLPAVSPISVFASEEEGNCMYGSFFLEDGTFTRIDLTNLASDATSFLLTTTFA